MENNSKEKMIVRKKGTVVGVKLDKTAIVCVNSLKTHSKYGKKYTVTKRYKVHDKENRCKIGDTVEFIEVKPISKDKKYKIA